MALWPFRRKSGRKRSRSGAALSDAEGPPMRSQTANDLTTTNSPPRKMSQKKQRTDEQQQPQPTEAQKKLQRRARTYSFSPGRKDSIRLGQGRDHGTSATGDRPTRFSPEDQIEEETSKDHAEWHRVPTLYNSRKKSSKRRREDLDREAEIKAMSNNFTPRRPATESWMAGRPMKKDSKRAKTGLGRNSVPASDVSLPIPESIHSTMSSDSEHASYKVSALDTLAPRPTLRRSFNPRFGQVNASEPARTGSQKQKLMEPGGGFTEATLKAHKRIDSLADGLDAHDIRELMERDNRRRERKTQREQEKLERRLTRRAAKQRAAEEEARQNGTPPPQNMERGVLGREEHGLGLDPASTVRTSSRRRAPESQEVPAAPQTEEPSVEADARPQALNNFHRSESIPLDAHQEAQETQQAKAPATPPPEDSKPTKAPIMENKALHSKTSLASEERRRLSSLPSKSDLSEGGRKDSVASSRGKLTFASLFKWGSIRGNRRSSGPSSFSNTSREEMQAAGAGAGLGPGALPHSRSSEQVTERSSMATPPVVVPFTPAKMSSGVPKRTRSRFREDLPELPMSPPDSRVASPDVEPPLPVLTEAKLDEHTESGTAPIPIRYDTPASERRTIDETMRQTPTSFHRNTQNSPQPQSVSLASIDSEASWLSGRINKRSSSGMATRDSGISRTYAANRRSDNSTEHSSEEDLAASDEYLSNLATPSKETADPYPFGRRSLGEGRPSSDEGDSYIEGDMKWGSVDVRQPFLHGDGEMIKSREGLLNTVDEAVGKSSSEEGETPHLEHATSVDYGRKGHVRHLSAGSAKLLDITPRASIDSKGRSPSAARRSSGPLYI